MSLPNERAIALANCRDFLRRLLSPYVENGIKRIPKSVRRDARQVLKHLPTLYEINADLKKKTKYICKVELEKQIEKDFRRKLLFFEKAMRKQHGKAKKRSKKA